MAKLRFFYGEMGCGKTAKLIEEAQALAKGDFLIAKPAIDTKNGDKLLSRNKSEIPVDFLIYENDDIFEVVKGLRHVSHLFVDEAQFISKQQAGQLLKIATELNIEVWAFGLRLNFYLGDESFAGATRLLQIAHELNYIESKCDFCGNEPAIFSCLFEDGHIRTEGPTVLISDGKKVVDAHAICAKCYYKQLSEKRAN